MTKILSLLLISIFRIQSLYAGAPIVISYSENIETALTTQDILMIEQNIPENLIELRWQTPACNEIPDAQIHLCIDDAENLEVIKPPSKHLIDSLKVFKELKQKKELQIEQSEALFKQGIKND